MNSKFSTLMAGALLALSTSAFAAGDVLPIGAKASKVEGKKYFLIQNLTTTPSVTGLDDSDRVIGMTKNVDENTVSYVKADAATVNGKTTFSATSTTESINNYLWTVSESKIEGETDKYEYVFTNVATGEVLTVAYAQTPSVSAQYPLLADLNSTAANLTKMAFGGNLKYGASAATDLRLYVRKWQDAAISDQYYPLNWTESGGWKIYPESGSAYAGGVNYELYEATDVEVGASDLNKLYNSNGFNFQIPDKDNVTNIFNEGRVKAIKVPKPMYLDGNGVKLTATAPESYFGIPAGTYFAVETPGATPAWDINDDEDDQLVSANAMYDFLLNCTLIAADPTENMSSSADLRKVGEGFGLTTVSGKDLNFFMSTLASAAAAVPASQKTSGSDVSVLNACFTVKTNINQTDKYAISLGNFYYQEKTSSADHKLKPNVQLSLKSNGTYGSSEYLVTVPGGASSYLFKYVESSVVKATDLLSADGASIYNIQFVSGYSAGTYLTDFNNEFYAKGEVLADLDAPEFQYLITKVNGNELTFTNRASGKTLITKLFDEGDGVYSIAANANAGTYDVLDLDRSNNIIVSVDDRELSGAYVKLLPVLSVDKFYGYLNVDDETKVTMAFARDFTPTSNKMYPEINGTTTGIENILTDEVAEAAQWQLLKSYYPTYETKTYAYLNANDKVAYKTKGDTIAYYQYVLELMKDGAPAGKYLVYTGNTNNNYNATLATTLEGAGSARQFIIKENMDGSVSMFKAADGAKSVQALAVKGFSDDAPASMITEWTREIVHENMVVTAKATNIKTYLVQDAPEVSLPATATYVTLKSEMGNFISMNEDKDGIVVNSDPLTFRLFATDLNAVVPSFLISTGFNAEDKARDFLFNPEDSVNYYVGAGQYDKEYQWAENTKKALFKSGILCETNDTLTTSIKGKVTEVATNADRTGVKAGLNRFKFQIVLAEDEDDLYVIRQLSAGYDEAGKAENYLSSVNDKLTWSGKAKALKFRVADTVSPTANEAIEAAGVQVIGGQGVVTVQGAAGKVITVANILGQTIANQVAASDNVTIAAPAGIVVVAVEGEATKVVVK